MQTNLTLIGMPGAGKSTVGIILAKNMGLGFIDTDVLIQINRQKSLQQILDESDHLNSGPTGPEKIPNLNAPPPLVATAGRAAYSDAAMSHLQRISTIVFLEVSFAEIERRIRNFSTRGIAKAKNQTFRELFDERQILYKKYAELTVSCDGFDQEEVAQQVAEQLPGRRHPA